VKLLFVGVSTLKNGSQQTEADLKAKLGFGRKQARFSGMLQWDTNFYRFTCKKPIQQCPIILAGFYSIKRVLVQWSPFLAIRKREWEIPPAMSGFRVISHCNFTSILYLILNDN
jgi:hypothetical protein